MTRTTTYLLAGGALAALLLLAGKASSGQQPAPGPAPAPGPNPPGPNPNVDILRAQLQNLLLQADLAPNTVDPTSMDILANQLEAAGLVQEAATLRAKAAETRARQNLPPIPRPA
jgi:hypothetical protein